MNEEGTGRRTSTPSGIAVKFWNCIDKKGKAKEMFSETKREKKKLKKFPMMRA